jgi:putative flippase GtrA
VNTFFRWWKFNLVGAMGMVLQLTVIALLDKWTGDHYLCATAVAVELALLHNFVWHLRYTWHDRCHQPAPLTRFVRFHLSNGLVSLLGNLLLMPVLVHQARMPVLISNTIAVLCCSIANFCLGDSWVFATRT